MSESLEFAQSILDAQPFHAQVGGTVTRFEPGSAALEIPIADHLRQQYGVVHGGVLAYAADNVLTFAGGSVLGASVITAGMTVSYLRAARDGHLHAEGRVVHHTEAVAVCTAEIHQVAPDGTRSLCAVAQGTINATRRGATAR